MKNLKVVAKLMVLIVTLVSLLILSGVMSINLSKQINDSATYTARVATMALSNADDMMAAFNLYRAQEYLYVAALSQDNRDRALDHMVTSIADFDTAVANYKELDFKPEWKEERIAAIEEIETQFDEYLNYSNLVIEAAGSLTDAESTRTAITMLVEDGAKMFDDLSVLIDARVTAQEESVADMDAETDLQYANAVTITLVIIGVSVIAAIIIAIMVIKSIMVPLRDVEKSMVDLAAGKLDTTINYHAKDEFGSLAHNARETIKAINLYIGDMDKALGTLADGDCTYHSTVNYIGNFKALIDSYVALQKKLNGLLSQVSQSSEQVSSGSEQVSAGAQALSQGATQQASAIEELAATIGEISGQVEQTSANAKEANTAVQKASSDVKLGNVEMEKMMAAMDEISKTSTQIGNIVKSIEDIAFQTNILALNAAVEAARAGEAGKGFAVVADEVRNLASKSAEAAKNTTTLIESSVKAVENGTQIASHTSGAMQAVSESARITAEYVAKIAIASEQQAEGISQVSQGIDEISTVVQTNSATAEESAAASQELSGQAYVLKQLLETFKLDMDMVNEQMKEITL